MTFIDNINLRYLWKIHPDNHILQSINLILYLNLNYKPYWDLLLTNTKNILSKLNIVIPNGKTPISCF